MPGTPCADRRMRLRKLLVWPEMNSMRRPAGRQLGEMNSRAACERLRDFRAHLNRALLIQIQGHMPPRLWQVRGADKRPDLPASRGHKPGELSRFYAAANDRGGNWLRKGCFNFVGHDGLPLAEISLWFHARDQHGLFTIFILLRRLASLISCCILPLRGAEFCFPSQPLSRPLCAHFTSPQSNRRRGFIQT